MPNEEQEQEIEVLQSIYPDELTSMSTCFYLTQKHNHSHCRKLKLTSWYVIVIDNETIRIRIPLETPPGFELPGDTEDDGDADEPTPRSLPTAITLRF